MASSLNDTVNATVDLASKSLDNLRRVQVATWGLTTVGSYDVISNILILIVLSAAPHNSKLRSHTFTLIKHLAVADGLVGVAYVFTGVKRVIRLSLLIDELMSLTQCCAEMFLANFSQIASIVFALLIALDRFVAVALPVSYAKWNKTHANMAAALAWVYSFILGALMFMPPENGRTAVTNCNLVSTTAEWYYSLVFIHNITIVVLIAVVYAGVWVAIRLQRRHMKKAGRKRNEIEKTLETKIALMLAVMGVLYFVTQALPSWLMSLLKTLAPNVRTTIAPYIRCVMIFNSGVNVLVYYGLNSAFRRQFKLTILRVNLNNVVPFTSKTHGASHPSSEHRKGVSSEMVNFHVLALDNCISAKTW